MYIKSLIARILRFVLRKIINNKFILDEIDRARRQRLSDQAQRLLNRLQSCGAGVRINGRIFISDPEFACIGNNVHIGENAWFVTRGGLTIGDNTHISRNVTIYTVNHNYNNDALPYDSSGIPKPVAIGRNVWIGMNVSIIPGIQIGDGAIIGLGAVVTNNVPLGAIIGSPSSRLIKYRDQNHYNRLEKDQKYGGAGGNLLSKEEIKMFKRNANDSGGQIFFVVTTGRSGSLTISHTLSQHPEISCSHEPRRQLVRLSTEYAHGQKKCEQIKSELFSIFCNSGVFSDGVYGESDQKFWNLISPLAELIPTSKFIWLIRDGRNVAGSTYARGWFSPEQEIRSPPVKYDFRTVFFYRLNGSKCGAMTADEWDAMSVFERNCWYWAYINKNIEDQLKKLSSERYLMVRLEQLSEKLTDVFGFLGVEPIYVDVPILNYTGSKKLRFNTRLDKPLSWPEWESRKIEEFEKWCGTLMNDMYPGWKGSNDEMHIWRPSTSKTIYCSEGFKGR